jgi:hypothetical protein
MTKNNEIREADIDRLMHGQIPADDAANGDVARFFETLDRVVPEAPTTELEPAHIAEVFRVAAEMPDPDAAPVPEERPRRIFIGFFERSWVKIASISLAGVLALGGTAYAGVLPAPIQNAVSAASQSIGITLPKAKSGSESSTKPNQGGTGAASPSNSGTSTPGANRSIESSTAPRSENASHTPGVDKSTAANHGRTVSAARKAAAAKAAASRNAAKKAAAKKAAAARAAAAKKSAAKKAAAKAKAAKKSHGNSGNSGNSGGSGNSGNSNGKSKKP